MSLSTLASALIIAAFVHPTLVRAQRDNNAAGCECYLTNGSTPAYFQYHDFHDWRTVDSQYVAVPSILTTATGSTNAGVASSLFTNDAWSSRWDIQKWNNSDVIASGASDASVLMVNSANNVYIESADSPTASYQTHLTLRTNRQSTFQGAAEIDSIPANYLYVSARFYARVIGSPGACAGMFTYRTPSGSKKREVGFLLTPSLEGQKPWEKRAVAGSSSDANVQEADIEILTSGPRNVVQYTNQPSNSPSGNALVAATVNGSLPGEVDWSQWNSYRLDWTKGLSEWYVNGVKQAKITFQAPKDPAQLIVNMWSDGGSWTGNMSQHDSAYLQLQYMQVVYNTSGPTTRSKRSNSGEEETEGEKEIWRRAKQQGCKVVCSIDQTTDVGTPVLVVNNTAGAWSVVVHQDEDRWRWVFVFALAGWLSFCW